jgi:hypothetical protein
MQNLNRMRSAQLAAVVLNPTPGEEINAPEAPPQAPPTPNAAASSSAQPAVAGLDPPVERLREFIQADYSQEFLDQQPLPTQMMKFLTEATDKFKKVYVRWLSDSEQAATVQSLSSQGVILKTLQTKPYQFLNCDVTQLTADANQALEALHQRYQFEAQAIILQKKLDLVEIEKDLLEGIEQDFINTLDGYINDMRNSLNGSNPKLATALGYYSARTKRQFNAEMMVFMDHEWLKRESIKRQKEEARRTAEAAKALAETMDVELSVREVAKQEAEKAAATARQAAVQQALAAMNKQKPHNNNNQKGHQNNNFNNNNAAAANTFNPGSKNGQGWGRGTHPPGGRGRGGRGRGRGGRGGR